MALARAEGSLIDSTACPLRSSRRSRTITAPWRLPKRELDITDWLEWFIGCFARAVSGAADSLNRIMAKAARWDRLNAMFEPTNVRER